MKFLSKYKLALLISTIIFITADSLPAVGLFQDASLVGKGGGEFTFISAADVRFIKNLDNEFGSENIVIFPPYLSFGLSGRMGVHNKLELQVSLISTTSIMRNTAFLFDIKTKIGLFSTNKVNISLLPSLGFYFIFTAPTFPYSFLFGPSTGVTLIGDYTLVTNNKGTHIFYYGFEIGVIYDINPHVSTGAYKRDYTIEHTPHFRFKVFFGHNYAHKKTALRNELYIGTTIVITKREYLDPDEVIGGDWLDIYIPLTFQFGYGFAIGHVHKASDKKNTSLH